MDGHSKGVKSAERPWKLSGIDQEHIAGGYRHGVGLGNAEPVNLMQGLPP